MVAIVRHTDALIHRLLQQNSRSTSDASAEKSPKTASVNDQVNISSAARAQQTQSAQVPQYSQDRLESQLLKLHAHTALNKGGG